MSPRYHTTGGHKLSSDGRSRVRKVQNGGFCWADETSFRRLRRLFTNVNWRVVNGFGLGLVIAHIVGVFG